MNSNYYVYINQDKDGKVFYVGKGKVAGTGRSYRHISWTNRSKEWEDIAKKGCTSQILTYGSEQDMLYLESNLIKSLTESGMNLVNKYFSVNYESVRKGLPNITWRSDKSSELYMKRRRKQRQEFYKQKEAA